MCDKIVLAFWKLRVGVKVGVKTLGPLGRDPKRGLSMIRATLGDALAR